MITIILFTVEFLFAIEFLEELDIQFHKYFSLARGFMFGKIMLLIIRSIICTIIAFIIGKMFLAVLILWIWYLIDIICNFITLCGLRLKGEK